MIYDPDTWRPYCHVLDFSRAIDKILSHKNNSLDFEIFNVGNDNNNYSKTNKAYIKFSLSHKT